MQEHATGHGTWKLYWIAFLSSLLLTLFSYLFAPQLPSAFIGAFGLIQAWILLYCLLDVGREPKPQWNLIVVLFTLMVTFIVILGSMWIMYHLQYNLMEHT